MSARASSTSAPVPSSSAAAPLNVISAPRRSSLVGYATLVTPSAFASTRYRPSEPFSCFAETTRMSAEGPAATGNFFR